MPSIELIMWHNKFFELMIGKSVIKTIDSIIKIGIAINFIFLSTFRNSSSKCLSQQNGFNIF
jgi:hypothetical protein